MKCKSEKLKESVICQTNEKVRNFFWLLLCVSTHIVRTAVSDSFIFGLVSFFFFLRGSLVHCAAARAHTRRCSPCCSRCCAPLRSCAPILAALPTRRVTLSRPGAFVYAHRLAQTRHLRRRTPATRAFPHQTVRSLALPFSFERSWITNTNMCSNSVSSLGYFCRRRRRRPVATATSQRPVAPFGPAFSLFVCGFFQKLTQTRRRRCAFVCAAPKPLR